MTADQSPLTELLPDKRKAAIGAAVEKGSGKDSSERDHLCVKVLDAMEVSKSSAEKENPRLKQRVKKELWWWRGQRLRTRDVRSGYSTLLVKPRVREILLLYAASWLGAVLIQRWRGRLWQTPWVNSHYTLFSAEQWRHQKNPTWTKVFLCRKYLPKHVACLPNCWMQGRGFRRMG